MNNAYLISDSKKRENKIETIYSKFKEYTTSNEYGGIIQNNTYKNLLDEAAQNSCTLKPQSVSLTKQTEDTDNIQYQYKVTIQLTFTNGQTSKTITQSGQIQLSNQNGWKVSFIRPTDKTLF